MFGQDVNLKFWTDLCSEVFGEEFNEERLMKGIENTKKKYDGVLRQSGALSLVQIRRDTVI